jgi:hypothetical protein
MRRRRPCRQAHVGLRHIVERARYQRRTPALQHRPPGPYDTDYGLRALWGLWVDRMNEGAVGDALRLAERFSLLASRSPDPIDLPIGERTMGVALHCACGVKFYFTVRQSIVKGASLIVKGASLKGSRSAIDCVEGLL